MSIEQVEGKWRMKLVDGIKGHKSDDPDSSRIFWGDGGVAQNLTFPVHPDPISGMHCWHQKIKLEPAHPGDEFADVEVDTEKAYDVYLQWLEKTRPAPGPGGLRRPLWLKRPLRPTEDKFYV